MHPDAALGNHNFPSVLHRVSGARGREIFAQGSARQSAKLCRFPQVSHGIVSGRSFPTGTVADVVSSACCIRVTFSSVLAHQLLQSLPQPVRKFFVHSTLRIVQTVPFNFSGKYHHFKRGETAMSSSISSPLSKVTKALLRKSVRGDRSKKVGQVRSRLMPWFGTGVP